MRSPGSLPGPWAVVAGGSSGLGLALGRALARRGLNLLLAGRRPQALEAAREELTGLGVQVQTMAADLSRPEAMEGLLEAAADLEVGTYVHNAAAAPVGPFLETAWEEHEQVLALNCQAASRAAWHFGGKMADRGSGAILLVSSQASFQGTALVAHYAASKAYLRVLAEGLWAELGPRGVKVAAACPGLVDTPSLQASGPALSRWLGPKPADPNRVAEESLRALEAGQPVVVPGDPFTRLTVWVTTRLVPKAWAIRLVSAGTRLLYPDRDPLAQR